MNAPCVGSILVTGASGFVGTHLLKALARDYPASTIVGTGVAPHPGSGIVHLDIANAREVRELVGRLRPEVCIHLAALASVDQSFREPRAVWDINLGGSLNLGEALLEIVPGCRLIHASTAEVYGLSFQSGEPAREDTTVLSPANPYAASKAAADLALGEMGLRGLRLIRLRLFNHTGPGQTERYVLPRFAAQVARIAAGMQEPLIETGALDRWRDFLDVRDVVDAYLAAIRAAEDGLCVNICSGVARRVGDVLNTLLEIAGVDAEVCEQTSALRKTDVRTVLGSAERAEALLDWRPRIAWQDTVASLLSHWRAVAAAPC